MKWFTLAALALLPTVAQADPSTSVEFSIYPFVEPGEPDALGLNGTEFKFTLYYAQESYTNFGGNGEPVAGLTYNYAELYVSNGPSWLDTYYEFYNGTDSGIFGVIDEGTTAGFLPLLTPMTEVVSLQLDDALFLLMMPPGWAISGHPQVGDMINPSDLLPVALDPDPFLMGFSTNGGEPYATYGYSFFPTTAVPEPSTYAAIAGLGVLSFVALRRRK